MQRAIRMAQSKLKTIKIIPENGLVLFVGSLPNKSADISELLSPPLPIRNDYYRCDNRFHIEMVDKLFEQYDSYGYVILKSKEVILLQVKGSKRKILYKNNVDLSTETRRGGFSANRLKRIRDEKRQLLLDKINEKIINHFSIMKSLIIVGNAELPTLLLNKLKKDTRLNMDINGVIKISDHTSIEDIIEMSFGIFKNKNIQKEKEVLNKIKDLMANNPEKLVFGNEIFDKDSDYMLEYIVVNKDKKNDIKDKIENSGIKWIEYSGNLKEYDGMIGVFYYVM